MSKTSTSGFSANSRGRVLFRKEWRGGVSKGVQAVDKQAENKMWQPHSVQHQLHRVCAGEQQSAHAAD